MKISVIVPIYNVENYIEECLNSLLNQTLGDIEIILVNDGSTDASILKINKIIQENDNIKLINKENGGLSSARNTGLEYATGDYISFIDSDDYIKPYFLERLYKEAIKYDLDIAIGGYQKLHSNNKFEIINRNQILYDINVSTGIEFLKQEVILNDYRMEVWDDLYKTEFLKKNNFKFEDGVLHEDELFTPLVFLKAKRVKLVPTNDYIYRQRENSIMSNKPTINHIKSYLIIINKLLDIFCETSSTDIKYILSKILIDLCRGYVFKISKSDIKDKRLLLNYLKNNGLTKAISYKNIFNKKQKFCYFLLKNNVNVFYLYVKYRSK